MRTQVLHVRVLRLRFFASRVEGIYSVMAATSESKCSQNVPDALCQLDPARSSDVFIYQTLSCTASIRACISSSS